MVARGAAVAALIGLAGCAAQDRQPFLPQPDLSPLGCGYKWFQTGYSPVRRVPCDADRSALHTGETALAEAHAWEVPRTRCPEACPPVPLQDTAATAPAFPEGRCYDGYVYYTFRIFAQCRREGTPR